MKRVCVSGYFNPVHKGHIELFERAKRLGDKLVVIVNSDLQVGLKGTVPFMDQDERAFIISKLEMVDEVHISIDDDRTVRKSLAWLKPDIFANGGDRTNDEIPEGPVCREHGIEMVHGLGDKVQSSSTLLKNANINTVRK